VVEFSSADEALLQSTGRKVARLEALMEGFEQRLVDLKEGQVQHTEALSQVLTVVRDGSAPKSTTIRMSSGTWTAVGSIIGALGLVAVALINAM